LAKKWLGGDLTRIICRALFYPAEDLLALKTRLLTADSGKNRSRRRLNG